ncbi:hypothetical protein B0H17DRAFT_1142060 [Mycena rosella]|uniref:Uncharacterized protein n=1 Tax=Mycena rosella TaxID=1033263 RepID=A0AAD7CY26_MYCRO|nr:hypothetical protein B0H17DRAFT_1142060 [Mycena rosella]
MFPPVRSREFEIRVRHVPLTSQQPELPRTHIQIMSSGAHNRAEIISPAHFAPSNPHEPHTVFPGCSSFKLLHLSVVIVIASVNWRRGGGTENSFIAPWRVERVRNAAKLPVLPILVERDGERAESLLSKGLGGRAALDPAGNVNGHCQKEGGGNYLDRDNSREGKRPDVLRRAGRQDLALFAPEMKYVGIKWKRISGHSPGPKGVSTPEQPMAKIVARTSKVGKKTNVLGANAERSKNDRVHDPDYAIRDAPVFGAAKDAPRTESQRASGLSKWRAADLLGCQNGGVAPGNTAGMVARGSGSVGLFGMQGRSNAYTVSPRSGAAWGEFGRTMAGCEKAIPRVAYGAGGIWVGRDVLRSSARLERIVRCVEGERGGILAPIMSVGCVQGQRWIVIPWGIERGVTGLLAGWLEIGGSSRSRGGQAAGGGVGGWRAQYRRIYRAT